MDELYKKMMIRLKYLKSLEQTEEIKGRIKELTLVIVDVQQTLLVRLKDRVR